MRKSKIILPLALFSVASCTQQSEQKPNIVFFLMDDMGYGEVDFMGQEKIETPNIDALSRSGKIFTQHYSGSPVSAPSRCVFLTGLNTGHSVIRGNDEAGDRGNVWSHQAMFENKHLEGQKPMPANTRTIAHQLKDAGYTTACIGKWGLGYPDSESEPNKMGFDFFYGYNCQRMAHNYYPTHLYKDTARVYLNNKVLQPATPLDKGADPYDEKSYAKYKQNDYAPDFMFAEALNFIDKNANSDKPFFLWWTTPMPHVPLQAPDTLVQYYHQKFGDEEPYIGNSGYFPCRYPKATYAAMITYIDNQIGGIVQKLKDKGVSENTIIVFTSDNGPTFNGGTNSPWFDSARPFKSEYGWGKCFLHEGGVREPTVVVWPNKIKAGTRSDMVSIFYDWAPTFTEIAGAKSLNGDGISLLNELLDKGNQQQHEYLYWEFPEVDGSFAVRRGQWKLMVEKANTETPIFQLYNLETDQREQNNLYESNPEVAEQLMNIAKKEHVKSDNPKFQIAFFDK